jgi:hypothetical protein
MSTIKAFITRHPVATYFALTFTISLGGSLVVVGPSIPATRENSRGCSRSPLNSQSPICPLRT